MRIDDHAPIGDGETAAPVGRDGAIDGLCRPRFDASAACAAPLGDKGNGRNGPAQERRRRQAAAAD